MQLAYLSSPAAYPSSPLFQLKSMLKKAAIVSAFFFKGTWLCKAGDLSVISHFCSFFLHQNLELVQTFLPQTSHRYYRLPNNPSRTGIKERDYSSDLQYLQCFKGQWRQLSIQELKNNQDSKKKQEWSYVHTEFGVKLFSPAAFLPNPAGIFPLLILYKRNCLMNKGFYSLLVSLTWLEIKVKFLSGLLSHLLAKESWNLRQCWVTTEC